MQSRPATRLSNNLNSEAKLLHLENIHQASSIKYPLRLLHLVRNSCPFHTLARRHLFHLPSFAIPAPIRASWLWQVAIQRIGFTRWLERDGFIALRGGGHLEDVKLRGGAAQRRCVRERVRLVENGLFLLQGRIAKLIPFREDKYCA